MGENDTTSEVLETARILREHSYYRTRRTPLSYAKKIELLKTEKFTWLSGMDVDIDQGPVANGHGQTEKSPEPVVPVNEKVVKKKARVEDIITNIKKGKSMTKHATISTETDDDNSSFISMCTIREEHEEIDDLPPLKPSSVFEEPETKQDKKTVYLLPTQGEPARAGSMYVTASAAPGNQFIYQTLPQSKNTQQQQQQHQPKVMLNTVPPGNIVLNSATNTLLTQGIPGQQQRKLLVISRPGGTPLYLTHNFAPQGNTGTPVKASDTNVKANQPLIIQYNLPYPNNNCKIVNNVANAKLNISQPDRLNLSRPLDPGSRQNSLSVSFTANASNQASSTKTQKTLSNTTEKQKKKKRCVSKGPRKPRNEKNVGKQKRKNENRKTEVKSEQPKPALLTVRVSKRKKHRTEKAKLLDNNRKPKLTATQVKIKTEPVEHDDVYHPDSAENSPVNVENNAPSVETAPPTGNSNETGNLLRDPALLTREERALQRALMRFKEMEYKQAQQTVPRPKRDKKLHPVVNKSKRGLRKKMKLQQFNMNMAASRKRKLTSEGNLVSFVKRRKHRVEEQTAEGKSNKISRKRKAQEILVVGKKRKVDVVVSDDDEKKHSVSNKDKNITPSTGTKGAKHKPILVKLESPPSPLPPLPPPKVSPAQIKSPLKTPKPSSQTRSPAVRLDKSIDSSAEKQHRVKTYMLIPSYRGFKDFSPVVLHSRTRHKKGEAVKDHADETSGSAATKDTSTKKDIPLLVIETVNNKPVKQDIVLKDEQLRNVVTNSLRAQGMLTDDFEAMRKSADDEHIFDNREKRNVTVNRNTGETVLHKAARMGYDETVYHSIQQGFNSNAKDNAGWTPLHEACSRGHPNVVKVLVKYNADVNSCSNDGIRPIHDAADNGNTDSLRLLIAYGADPLLSTYSGRSCYDCAKNKNAKDFIKACIGDLYLTDERNNVAELDYEDRWEFRGSCSALDKDDKYMSGIFDSFPETKKRTSVEFEWSDAPHLPTYNLPLIKDGVIVGRKNYVKFQDLQDRLGKSRNTLIRLLKRTEIREVPWSEFAKEVSNNCFNKLCESPAGGSKEEPKVEVVPLNWNIRYLLKVKTESISL